MYLCRIKSNGTSKSQTRGLQTRLYETSTKLGENATQIKLGNLLYTRAYLYISWLVPLRAFRSSLSTFWLIPLSISPIVHSTCIVAGFTRAVHLSYAIVLKSRSACFRPALVRRLPFVCLLLASFSDLCLNKLINLIVLPFRQVADSCDVWRSVWGSIPQKFKIVRKSFKVNLMSPKIIKSAP